MNRGGVYERFRLRRLKMRDIDKEAIRFSMNYGNVQAGDFPPTFRNLTISGVECEGAGKSITLMGLPQSEMQSVVITDCKFRGLREQGSVDYVSGLSVSPGCEQALPMLGEENGEKRKGSME